MSILISIMLWNIITHSFQKRISYPSRRCVHFFSKKSSSRIVLSLFVTVEEIHSVFYHPTFLYCGFEIQPAFFSYPLFRLKAQAWVWDLARILPCKYSANAQYWDFAYLIQSHDFDLRHKCGFEKQPIILNQLLFWLQIQLRDSGKYN